MNRGTWEEGYEVGYREGGDSATEDWKLVVEESHTSLNPPTGPVVRMVNGKLVIEWPDPKPRAFLISSELFEQLIAEINDSVEEHPQP